MLRVTAALTSTLRPFARDRSGNIAITFALALVPITAAVGGAIDYSKSNNLRTQLQAAADAASIGSVAKSSPALKAAAAQAKDGAISVGGSDALKIFNAEIAGKTGFTLDKVSATVTKSKGTITSLVEYTATVPASFMGMFGLNSISISGTSTASTDVPTFIDFFLLLDNSPSMGVAATPADINKMVSTTPDKCAFACHDLSDPNNYYNHAKKIGVTMRIDVLRLATQQLMDRAAQMAFYPDQFRVAIYTFNMDILQIAPLTSNLASAKTLASKIDLMPLPYHNFNNYQLTNFEAVIPAIDKLIATPGDGSAASAPEKFLFMVSDGVADYDKGGKRVIEPINFKLCEQVKKRGINIALLYTTYLPLPTNSFYMQYVAPFQPKIGPTMESCASPGLYFEVSPSQGIAEAMQALFQKAVAQARLTK